MEVIDPDFTTIDSILAGNTGLYATLIDRYKGYVFTISLKIVQIKADAEEASQDTFVKAFHGLRSFNRTSKFSTWLYRIAFNTAVSYKRKNRHQLQSLEKSIIEHPQESEGALEKADKTRYLNEALGRLSEADRTAITLFYMKEFSLEEIADITSTPANTIKVRIHRARIRIAEELKQILNEEALTL